MSSYRPKGNARFFAGRCKPQTGEHGFCRKDLGVEIKVCVDVGRGGKVAVAQPFLNLLHGNAVGQQKAGAGVAQVVQTDDAQVVLLEDAPEAVRQCVGL